MSLILTEEMGLTVVLFNLHLYRGSLRDRLTSIEIVKKMRPYFGELCRKGAGRILNCLSLSNTGSTHITDHVVLGIILFP